MPMWETRGFHLSELAEAAPFAGGATVQGQARKHRPYRGGKPDTQDRWAGIEVRYDKGLRTL